jgi:hypothetical protein
MHHRSVRPSLLAGTVNKHPCMDAMGKEMEDEDISEPETGACACARHGDGRDLPMPSGMWVAAGIKRAVRFNPL